MAEVIVVHGYPGVNCPSLCERIADEGLDGKVVRYAPATNELFSALTETPVYDLAITEKPCRVDAIDTFLASLRNTNHALRGIISLKTSVDASIERALLSLPTVDDPTQKAIIESQAIHDYNQHQYTIRLVHLALSSIAPIEEVDASGDHDVVYANFTSALGKLALSNS